MSQRRARVQIEGSLAGLLVEQDDEYLFEYDPAWLQRADAVPISLTMPLRTEPYASRRLHPFFENLLPEGWLLELSTARLKIPKDDAFGLLLATCRDCIGAIEILPAEVETGDSEEDDLKAGGAAV